jgi:tetratricopeptide (TPR) repeat protein
MALLQQIVCVAGRALGDRGAELQAQCSRVGAIALDPNNADSYVRKGAVLLFAGRPEDALRMLEQALRLNPPYPPLYLWSLGWAYSLTGRYTEAVATLQEFISRSPSHLGGHLYLALSYVQQWACQQSADAQTLAQAVAAAQRVLALNDAYFGGHLILGYVYLWQKQYEQALTEMERAIALDPNVAESYAGLAETLSHVGRSEEPCGWESRRCASSPVLRTGT